MLRDEERQCKKAVVANPGVDLMIKEFLDVVDGEQVFTIHWDDDGIPYLWDKDLWCNRPKHHYFCTSEMESPKFTWFLIHIVKTLLLLQILFLHTLFFFELYFDPYLIGTMISWSLDLVLIWYHDLIFWSYLTDDIMFLPTCARHILWILPCFRHVLHKAYTCYSFPVLCLSCI